MTATINWSQLSLAELEDRYWNTITPDLQRDGHDSIRDRLGSYMPTV